MPFMLLPSDASLEPSSSFRWLFSRSSRAFLEASRAEDVFAVSSSKIIELRSKSNAS